MQKNQQQLEYKFSKKIFIYQRIKLKIKKKKFQNKWNVADEIGEIIKVQKKIETKIKEDSNTYKGFEDFGSIQSYLLKHKDRDREMMRNDIYWENMVRVLM